MYRIYKITADPVVDYAAEELKRYLRMMVPRCGEIIITYAPEAKDTALSFFDEFGRHEVTIERYYDHMLMVRTMNVIFNTKSSMDQ